MDTLALNIGKVRNSVPAEINLIAVSKTKTIDQILEVYHCGQKTFGESKAQELVSKYDQLPKDITWHMIGHLQTNKVKYIAPFVSLIHSVDSFKLLQEINKQAKKNHRVIDCLLQMHIAEEETKFGLDYDEACTILNSEEYYKLNNICIRGLMCMATFTDNQEQIRKEFRQLTSYFEKIKKTFFQNSNTFTERSMGMSDDYLLAIEEGTTMVRVGSLIFGNR